VNDPPRWEAVPARLAAAASEPRGPTLACWREPAAVIDAQTMIPLHWHHTTGCSSAWLERLLWEQEVAGSNPVIPTQLDFEPFDEFVKRLSLFQFKTYVAECAVQRWRFEDSPFLEHL
jgi:hypothetical protein